MEQLTDTLPLLDQVPQPVFLVKEGIITHANHAALARQVEVFAKICDFITIGKPEYAQFTGGRLFLTLTINNTTYSASVIKAKDSDLFCLESEFSDPELRALALASINLREPLSNALVSIGRLLPEETIQNNPCILKQMQQINQSLYQMYRTIGNMSDSAKYNAGGNTKAETLDVVSFINELIEKVTFLVEKTERTLVFHGLNQPLICLIDSEMLERAFLNLISNAVKFSDSGSAICVTLKLGKNKLYISVQSEGDKIDNAFNRDLFSRYLREPGIEDSRHGIGLGLTIVRGAATAHKGTLLLEQPVNEGPKFTMSISLIQPKNMIMRSPILLPIDYTGGYDRVLIELADILPPEAFE